MKKKKTANITRSYYASRAIKILGLRFQAWIIIPLFVYMLVALLWHLFIARSVGASATKLMHLAFWTMILIAFVRQRDNAAQILFWFGLKPNRMRKGWLESYQKPKMLTITRYLTYLVIAVELGILTWWPIFTRLPDWNAQFFLYWWDLAIKIALSLFGIIGIGQMWILRKTRIPVLIAALLAIVLIRLIWIWTTTVPDIWFGP